MRTIKTWFATIAVLLCSISVHAHHFEVDGIYYNIDDIFDLTVGVTFKGTYDDIGDYEGDVIIPESVTYNGNTYSVRFIYRSAFYNCKLTSIRIPGSVTSINHCAFEGCTLTSVTLPNSVKNLEEKAFYNCKLTSISIPESVTYISTSVFRSPKQPKTTRNNHL